MLSFVISLLGKRSGVALTKFLPYLLGVLVVLLTLWWVDSNGFDRGVETTELKYQTAIQEERTRQSEANEEALAEARHIQLKLERLLDERNTEIDELLLEGSEDPDADRRAISDDSVWRLNRLR
jgi:hypothetical protein